MAYTEDLNVCHNFQTEPVQQQKVDYNSLPIEEVYNASQVKDTNEFKTFKQFLQFKKYLDFTGRLEQEGVITINRPTEPVYEVIEGESEEQRKFGKFFLYAVGTLIAIGILF
jgi:hypothetical protein